MREEDVRVEIDYAAAGGFVGSAGERGNSSNGDRRWGAVSALRLMVVFEVGGKDLISIMQLSRFLRARQERGKQFKWR